MYMYLPYLQHKGKFIAHVAMSEAGNDSVDCHQDEKHSLYPSVVPLLQCLGELDTLLSLLSLEGETIIKISGAGLLR